MEKRNSISFKNAIHGICLILFVLSYASCPTENEPEPDERAAINFFNESSYRVDVYKNFNPSYFDPTTRLCAVNAGQSLKILAPASVDQLVGDTFYLRYKIPMTVENTGGVLTFHVDAKTTLQNITFVVEKNKTYTKTIPSPPPGQLVPTDGYLKIQNQEDHQIRIEHGGILSREDNGALYLLPGQMGYYKIVFSYFDATSIKVNQLKAFGTSYADFPPFTMELGTLYHFRAKGNVIILEGTSPLLVH